MNKIYLVCANHWVSDYEGGATQYVDTLAAFIDRQKAIEWRDAAEKTNAHGDNKLYSTFKDLEYTKGKIFFIREIPLDDTRPWTISYTIFAGEIA